MNLTDNEKAAAKRHYWVREDFDHLMGLLPGADRVTPNGNKQGSTLEYPKHTEGAVSELKLRGLTCDGEKLVGMVSEGIVKPELMAGSQSIYMWEKADIDAAAEHLFAKREWNSWTHFCFVGNLRFGQAVKAYRVAAAKYGLGFSMSFDILGLTTVIEPAENAATDYGWVKFFPADVSLDPQEEG